MKIYIENPEFYDGWCLIFDKITKKIEWRDHYKINQLSNQIKKKYENLILKSFK